MQTNFRTERLEARITPEQKYQIQYAANLLGSSVTDFIIRYLQEAATKIIQEHEIINLSMQDQKTFIKTLLNAPQPTSRLLQAKKLYDKKVQK